MEKVPQKQQPSTSSGSSVGVRLIFLVGWGLVCRGKGGHKRGGVRDVDSSELFLGPRRVPPFTGLRAHLTTFNKFKVLVAKRQLTIRTFAVLAGMVSGGDISFLGSF